MPRQMPGLGLGVGQFLKVRLCKAYQEGIVSAPFFVLQSADRAPEHERSIHFNPGSMLRSRFTDSVLSAVRTAVFVKTAQKLFGETSFLTGRGLYPSAPIIPAAAPDDKTDPRGMLCRFVRDNFGIRSGNIPSDILRPLRIKYSTAAPDLSGPRFRTVHELMRCIVALYEDRLNVKIRFVGTADYVRMLCSKDCDCRLCGFLEYLFDAGTRTVYIERWEYENRMLTLLDYAGAVLRSRGLGRRRVRNIRLFRVHAYPSRSFVALNRLLTRGSPFFRDGDRYLTCPPDELRKTRYLFNGPKIGRL